MKTPKRESNLSMFDLFADPESAGAKFARWKRKCARWKRKNRVKQYKRTIARLTRELTAERRQLNALWLGDHLKRFSPEWDAFIQLRGLKTPADDATLDEKFEYWITLRKVGGLALNAACLAAMDYGEAKERASCHPETADSGQQTDLPTTGGQQYRKEKK